MKTKNNLSDIHIGNKKHAILNIACFLFYSVMRSTNLKEPSSYNSSISPVDSIARLVLTNKSALARQPPI